jgi:hypothetical protein
MSRLITLLLLAVLAGCAGGWRGAEAGTTVSAAFDAAASAQAADAPVTGPLGVQVLSVEFDWHDAARGRTVPVRLYLPREAVERSGLAPGGTVAASRRPYGVELAHADTRRAFFLLLDDDFLLLGG